MRTLSAGIAIVVLLLGGATVYARTVRRAPTKPKRPVPVVVAPSKKPSAPNAKKPEARPEVRKPTTPASAPAAKAPVTPPKTSAAPPTAAPKNSPPVTTGAEKEQVMINGVTISAEQLATLQSTYGARPKPGKYWYDRVSGLYGTVGQGSTGFMLPGHSFGILVANASNGTSGVFFNGRQLTTVETAYIESIIATQAIPGRYWFDEYGNVGVEGSPVPLLNLAVAGASRGGGGGGGDNFWSSRFSAGNSNADNSQGYVSVPGYGPVGYGF